MKSCRLLRLLWAWGMTLGFRGLLEAVEQSGTDFVTDVHDVICNLVIPVGLWSSQMGSMIG